MLPRKVEKNHLLAQLSAYPSSKKRNKEGKEGIRKPPSDCFQISHLLYKYLPLDTLHIEQVSKFGSKVCFRPLQLIILLLLLIQQVQSAPRVNCMASRRLPAHCITVVSELPLHQPFLEYKKDLLLKAVPVEFGRYFALFVVFVKLEPLQASRSVLRCLFRFFLANLCERNRFQGRFSLQGVQLLRISPLQLHALAYSPSRPTE